MVTLLMRNRATLGHYIRTIQGPMRIRGGGVVSYERGIPAVLVRIITPTASGLRGGGNRDTSLIRNSPPSRTTIGPQTYGYMYPLAAVWLRHLIGPQLGVSSRMFQCIH